MTVEEKIRCSECESYCEYFDYIELDDDDEYYLCCKCDRDIEPSKMCSIGFSHLVSDIHDQYKAKREMRLK